MCPAVLLKAVNQRKCWDGEGWKAKADWVHSQKTVQDPDVMAQENSQGKSKSQRIQLPPHEILIPSKKHWN